MNYTLRSLIHLLTLAASLLLVNGSPNRLAADETTREINVSVGVQLPLSGDLAFAGQDIQRGIDLALEDLLPSPIKLTVHYEDDRASAVQAASASQRLIMQKKVDVAVSLWDMAEIVAPVAERAKIPHLSIRWNPHVAEQYSYTFTLESTYKTFARYQLALAQASGAKTLGLITEESTGWNLVRDYIEASAKEYGLSVVSSDAYTPAPGLDLRPVVTRALSRKPDFLIINNFQPWIVPTIRLIRQLNRQQKFTGYFEGIEQPQLVEGIPFVNQSNTSALFQERFLKKYGERFKMRAPHAYDIVKIIHDAYVKSPSRKATSDELVSSLKAVKNYQGQSGILTTNATKNIETEPVYQVLRNGIAQPFSLLQLMKDELNSRVR